MVMLRDTQRTPVAAWRSEYDRYREIYEIASEHSKRLRAQLTRAAHEASLLAATPATPPRGITRSPKEQRNDQRRPGE
jgi:hypothetical protein